MVEELTVRDRLNSLTSRHVARESDEETLDDLAICGLLRGVGERALMLEFRFKTGNILALGYAWLEKAEFDATEGITLHFVNAKVRLKGRNLRQPLRGNTRLFDGIVRQRIPWVQECDRTGAALMDEAIPIITEIHVQQ